MATAVVEGARPPEIVATLLDRHLIARADHAAYLARELTLAERSLVDGTAHVRDRAPGRQEHR